jgi:DNA-binding beta-propeller fold protein YncE
MNLIRAAALVALALGACNLENPGYDAPVGELAYPIAIALSDPSREGGPSYLYVANSNFDLRFNGGSVQSYDLDVLEQKLRENNCLGDEADVEPEQPLDAGGEDADIDAAPPDPDAGQLDPDVGAFDAEAGVPDPDAGALDADADLIDAELPEGGGPDAARVPILPILLDAGHTLDELHTRANLCDGRGGNDPRFARCCFNKDNDLDAMRKSEVSVDSYASGITTSPDGAHIYVPLRSDSRLLHLDVHEGELSCGETTGRCRRGPKHGAKAEIDDLEMPALPTTVVSGPFSALNISERPEKDFVATAHEKGELSLFALSASGSPKLLYTLPNFFTFGTTLPPRATSLNIDNGFFLIGSSQGPSIGRVGARADLDANEGRDPPAIYPYATQPIDIKGLTFNFDIRDAQADERDRAAGTSHRYYALLRGNTSQVIQSVAFLELDSSSPDGSLALAIDAVRVGVGLSKLLQVDFNGRHLLFVSCYQDGEIHVIDADVRKTVTVIRDVLGPSDMQVDVARSLLYVPDFRASVLRVVDLRPLARAAGGVPRVVATLGATYLPGYTK